MVAFLLAELVPMRPILLLAMILAGLIFATHPHPTKTYFQLNARHKHQQWQRLTSHHSAVSPVAFDPLPAPRLATTVQQSGQQGREENIVKADTTLRLLVDQSRTTFTVR